jgi:hypothetical protein
LRAWFGWWAGSQASMGNFPSRDVLKLDGAARRSSLQRCHSPSAVLNIAPRSQSICSILLNLKLAHVAQRHRQGEQFWTDWLSAAGQYANGAGIRLRVRPMYELSQPTNQTIHAIERCPCPKCHWGTLVIARIDQDGPGQRLLTYECSKCGYETVLRTP